MEYFPGALFSNLNSPEISINNLLWLCIIITRPLHSIYGGFALNFKFNVYNTTQLINAYSKGWNDSALFVIHDFSKHESATESLWF